MFITPHVVSSSEQMQAATERKKKQMKTAVDKIDPEVKENFEKESSDWEENSD